MASALGRGGSIAGRFSTGTGAGLGGGGVFGVAVMRDEIAIGLGVLRGSTPRGPWSSSSISS